MPLCELPEKPTKTSLVSSFSILERSHDAADAFFLAFREIRRARSARGTPTDHDQDLLRAALIFATAGLDSLVKQLVRDTLRQVISRNKGARGQFTEYVQSRLRRTDGIDIRFLAEAIAADRPTSHLQDALIAELTGSSLQSKDQLLRVAAYFAIQSEEITDDLRYLQEVFSARNQIAHEMDIQLGQSNRGRRQRRLKTMRGYSVTILETASAFYRAVEGRL